MDTLLQWGAAAPQFGAVERGSELLARRWVRPAALELRRAHPADVPAIADLLDRYARLGFVLPRAPEQIYRQIREFVVVVEGERVVGCGGLRIYNATLAEVVALAVAEEYQGKGVGRRIVEALLEEARMLAMRRVFALTLQETFFHQRGFRTVPMAEVPEKIAADKAEGIDRALCMKTTVVRDFES
jgi:amino-acid N-acetyltransferase